MNLALMLLIASGICYALSFVFSLLSFGLIFKGLREHFRRPAFFLLRVGFLAATFYFAAEAVEHGYFLPVASFSQALAFLSWALAFVYLVLLSSVKTDSFSLVLSPLLTVFVSLAIVTAHLPVKTVPMTGNVYFVMHIASAFFAYAAFSLSFVASVLYLIGHHQLKSKQLSHSSQKMPSLEELEKLVYQSMVWGLLLLILAIGVGLIWSKTVYGHIWVSDAKTISTVLTGIVYGALIYLHYVSSFHGKRGVSLSVLAFLILLLSFVGPRFVQSSHHFVQ